MSPDKARVRIIRRLPSAESRDAPVRHSGVPTVRRFRRVDPLGAVIVVEEQELAATLRAAVAYLRVEKSESPLRRMYHEGVNLVEIEDAAAQSPTNWLHIALVLQRNWPLTYDAESLVMAASSAHFGGEPILTEGVPIIVSGRVMPARRIGFGWAIRSGGRRVRVSAGDDAVFTTISRAAQSPAVTVWVLGRLQAVKDGLAVSLGAAII